MVCCHASTSHTQITRVTCRFLNHVRPCISSPPYDPVPTAINAWESGHEAQASDAGVELSDVVERVRNLVSGSGMILILCGSQGKHNVSAKKACEVCGHQRGSSSSLPMGCCCFSRQNLLKDIESLYAYHLNGSKLGVNCNFF